VKSTRTRLPGLNLVEHELEVPLAHDGTHTGTLTVFARELVADAPDATRFPLLVYFQGGPGFEAPRTPEAPNEGAWLHRALREYRLLLLDQRGTGRSSPVGALRGMSPSEQAEYLTHFRADSIVRDAELFRHALGADSWSVIGQSFGGFCVLTYLSTFPGSLDTALICGGLSPLGRPVDDVYARTYGTVAARCAAYYDRYPEDRERVREIHRSIERDGIVLPTGEALTSRRFRQLGLVLGMADGAQRLHHIVELPPDSPAFLHDVQRADDFSRNPLFAAIHEACYADGSATRWSAERLLPSELEPEAFTGEHIFSWMFEDYGALRPLREAAEILADHEWPRLYDEGRLAANSVPTAAVIYANDMYVPRDLSEDTVARVGAAQAWLTNEYEHDGLRADGAKILDRLLTLARS
jgi:pimeloyl-ACP methyl ester carboxylesterase